MAEWLRRWTRNPLGSARAGSNPADYDLDQFFFFFFFFSLPDFFHPSNNLASEFPCHSHYQTISFCNWYYRDCQQLYQSLQASIDDVIQRGQFSVDISSSKQVIKQCDTVCIQWTRGTLSSLWLALSPGHSQIFNVSACNIEKLGVAWGWGWLVVCMDLAGPLQ